MVRRAVGEYVVVVSSNVKRGDSTGIMDGYGDGG